MECFRGCYYVKCDIQLGLKISVNSRGTSRSFFGHNVQPPKKEKAASEVLPLKCSTVAKGIRTAVHTT